MKIQNEKIEVSVIKDKGSTSTIIEVNRSQEKKLAEKRLYNTLAESIVNNHVESLVIKCDDIRLAYSLKYKDEVLHPDYGCDIAKKITRQFLKAVWKDQGAAHQAGMVQQGGHGKLFDRKKICEGISWFADRLNGISMYYTDVAPVSAETDVKSACTEISVKEEHKSEDQTESAEDSEASQQYTVIPRPAENFVESDTYINRKNGSKFAENQEHIETLFSVEVANFRRGYVQAIVVKA